MKMSAQPSRGEIWLIDLNPTRGREQHGIRPCLVVSSNGLNHGASGLVVVLPLTSCHRGIPSHVPLLPPEGGVRVPSYIKCEDIRSISHPDRLVARWGTVEETTMQRVARIVRVLLDL